MRIKSGLKELIPYQSGKVTMILDTLDDLWHFYNIICKGDLLQIKVSRKIVHEKSGSTTKKTFPATIKCQSIEYDTEVDEIRINGTNVGHSDFLSMGQFQSACIIRGVQFSIIKREWDPFLIEKLEVASNPIQSCDLAVLLMEEGISHLYLVSNFLTLLKGKVEVSIPKKRKGPSQHDKALEKFFSGCLESVTTHVNFDIVKCLVIGSPGFVKDQFSTYINDKIGTGNKTYESIAKNLKKIIYTHTSSGYKQALTELLGKSEVMLKIKDTKTSEEVLLMSRFNEVLSKDYTKVAIGLKAVEIAIEHRAIEFILISDEFLRKIGVKSRKTLQDKLKKCEGDGGSVRVMSIMLPTGEKVNSLGGIVSVLKFNVQEIDDIEDYETNYDEMQEEEKENVDEAMSELINNMNLDDGENAESKEKTEEDSLNYHYTTTKGTTNNKGNKVEKKDRKEKAFRKKSYDDDY